MSLQKKIAFVIVAGVFLFLTSNSAIGQLPIQRMAKKMYIGFGVQVHPATQEWGFSKSFKQAMNGEIGWFPYVSVIYRGFVRRKMSNSVIMGFNTSFVRGGGNYYFEMLGWSDPLNQFFLFRTITPGLDCMLYPNGKRGIPAPLGAHFLFAASFPYSRIYAGPGHLVGNGETGSFVGSQMSVVFEFGFGMSSPIAGRILNFGARFGVLTPLSSEIKLSEYGDLEGFNTLSESNTFGVRLSNVYRASLAIELIGIFL